MTSAPTIAAIRFGYGLPLPDAAPVTPEDMLFLVAAMCLGISIIVAAAIG